MAHIITGQNFSAGDQVTSGKLNNIIGDAKLDSDSITGTTLNLTNGELKVATNGITDNELNANSVTTAKIANDAVTYDKIQDVAANSVIGNTTGSTATPTDVAILDEATMASNSATALATQQSIKAYVDSQSQGASVYTSLETSLPSNNTTESWTHGLGQTPDVIKLILKCKTSEYSYAVGDEVHFTSEHTVNVTATSFWANSTTINLRYSISAGASAFWIVRRDTTGVSTPLTPANWKIIVKGIVF